MMSAKSNRVWHGVEGLSDTSTLNSKSLSNSGVEVAGASGDGCSNPASGITWSKIGVRRPAVFAGYLNLIPNALGENGDRGIGGAV